MRCKLVLPFRPVGCPSAQLSLDGPERGGEGGGGRAARDGVTRDGKSVDGVVGERGGGLDGEGGARDGGGAPVMEAVVLTLTLPFLRVMAD